MKKGLHYFKKGFFMGMGCLLGEAAMYAIIKLTKEKTDEKPGTKNVKAAETTE